MPFVKLLVGAVCILGLCMPALEAGVLIVSENESARGPKGVITSKAYIDTDRMLVNVSWPRRLTLKATGTTRSPMRTWRQNSDAWLAQC